MLDQAGGQVLVKDGVRLFGEYGVYPVWTGGDRGAARGYGNLEGDREQEPKSVFDVEKTAWNSQRTSPKSSITDGDHPEP